MSNKIRAIMPSLKRLIVIAEDVRTVLDASPIDPDSTRLFATYTKDKIRDELDQMIGQLMIKLGLHKTLGIAAASAAQPPGVYNHPPNPTQHLNHLIENLKNKQKSLTDRKDLEIAKSENIRTSFANTTAKDARSLLLKQLETSTEELSKIEDAIEDLSTEMDERERELEDVMAAGDDDEVDE